MGCVADPSASLDHRDFRAETPGCQVLQGLKHDDWGGEVGVSKLLCHLLRTPLLAGLCPSPGLTFLIRANK